MKQQHIIAWHVLATACIWGMLNALPFGWRFGAFQMGSGAFFWSSMYGIAFNALLFYGNAEWLIPRVLAARGYMLYWALLLGALMGITALEAWLDAQVLGNGSKPLDKADYWEISILALVVHIITLLNSMAYRFLRDWLQGERIKGRLQEEKLAAELAFLRSQINPHFLFNTLNNLFSMALKNGDEPTAEGIGKLAGLMRYMLHNSSATYIPLKDELEYLENYVDLQRLRLLPHIQCQFCVSGDAGPHSIAPMLLINFVENAFKYGLSNRQSSFIHICCKIEGDALHFSVSNSVHAEKKQVESSGLGIANAKRRLALLYPQQHELHISQTPTQFDVQLRLALKPPAA